jgi:hypothetical protein
MLVKRGSERVAVVIQKDKGRGENKREEKSLRTALQTKHNKINYDAYTATCSNAIEKESRNKKNKKDRIVNQH